MRLECLQLGVSGMSGIGGKRPFAHRDQTRNQVTCGSAYSQSALPAYRLQLHVPFDALAASRA
jgi:hypothetical protein